MSLFGDIKKYIDYVFDTKSFVPSFESGVTSGGALATAEAIRGVDRAPAIIIHGVMPRSGTVYVGELLRMHPDIVAYPNGIWEAPFLQLKEDISRLQAKFLWSYRHNVGKFYDRDFVPLFGSALIAYLYSFVPQGKRLLLKVPGVHHLSSFFTMFPYEHLLVLVRDGRDIVHSTVRTWPQLRFSFVCRRWRRSAAMVVACHGHFQHKKEGYWLARFEDALRDPVTFVKRACDRFNLDVDKYPFGEIQTIPVRGSSGTRRRGKVVWDPVSKPEGFDPTAYWHEWSKAKKRRFKRITGQSLVDLGYCEDQNW